MHNDEFYMKIALREAQKAKEFGEIPVGAILVSNVDHKILVKAHNKKETTKDVTSHAEIEALRKLCKKQKDYKLNDITMYVTLEPCLMCLGAILQSGIARVVYGAKEPLFGSVESKLDGTKYFKTKLIVTGGVLEEESKQLLNEFFVELRK